MSPKPPIQIYFNDPFYSATAVHFNSMIERYGSPIIALNLVKVFRSYCKIALFFSTMNTLNVNLFCLMSMELLSGT
jgi:hypothetical protein